MGEDEGEQLLFAICWRVFCDGDTKSLVPANVGLSQMQSSVCPWQGV